MAMVDHILNDSIQPTTFFSLWLELVSSYPPFKDDDKLELHVPVAALTDSDHHQGRICKVWSRSPVYIFVTLYLWVLFARVATKIGTCGLRQSLAAIHRVLHYLKPLCYIWKLQCMGCFMKPSGFRWSTLILHAAQKETNVGNGIQCKILLCQSYSLVFGSSLKKKLYQIETDQQGQLQYSPEIHLGWGVCNVDTRVTTITIIWFLCLYTCIRLFTIWATYLMFTLIRGTGEHSPSSTSVLDRTLWIITTW